MATYQYCITGVDYSHFWRTGRLDQEEEIQFGRMMRRESEEVMGRGELSKEQGAGSKEFRGLVPVPFGLSLCRKGPKDKG